MPIVFAIVSAAFYGTADFLGGLAGRRAPVVTVTFLSQAVGLVALLIAAVFMPGATRSSDLWWGVGAGVTGGAGVLLLYRALATGTASIAAPLISMIAMLVPVGVGVALGERLELATIAGVVLSLAAVALISGGGAPNSMDGAPVRFAGAPLLWACASGVLIGGFLVCLGRISPGASLWPLVISRGTGTIGMLLVALWQRAPLRPPAIALGPIVGAGLFDVAANLLFVRAAADGPLSVVASIVSMAPAATVIWAQIVFRERLSAFQRVGVALAFAAIFLLARSSAS